MAASVANRRYKLLSIALNKDHGAALIGLMLITIAIVTYLMNDYSVVNEQAYSPHKKVVGKGLSVVLHLLPNLDGYFSTLFQKFL